MSNLLARSPSRVRVAGETFHLPYRPAAEWVSALERPSVLAALLAEAEDRDRMADLVAAPGTWAVEDLRRESLRILAEATGRTWWEAGRLVSTSVDPETLGRLVLAGVDPWRRSIGEWCAATYALRLKGADEKYRLRFDFFLSVPPPGEEDEWDDGLDPVAAAEAVAAMKRGR